MQETRKEQVNGRADRESGGNISQKAKQRAKELKKKIRGSNQHSKSAKQISFNERE